jgi:hypothetical protein
MPGYKNFYETPTKKEDYFLIEARIASTIISGLSFGILCAAPSAFINVFFFEPFTIDDYFSTIHSIGKLATTLFPPLLP